MASHFDILGIGCVAVDDLMFVDHYPAPDAKLRVKRVERQFGGLTGTALVAASKLGAKCAFAGMLGPDELSAATEENFKSFGIDVSGVVRRSDARTIHSVIVVAEEGQTRNVFYDYSAPIGADTSGPSEEFIQLASVLFIDHLSIAGGIRGARIARANGIPVVADLEEVHDPAFTELLSLVDHLIVSEEFAMKLTGAPNPGTAAMELWDDKRDTVVVTCGSQGAWYLSKELTGPKHCRGFRVDVVDTTGCGDVFHGAYAVALAYGDDIHQRIRFANAAASLKATRPGGQTGAPTLKDLTQFLADRQDP